MAIEVGLLRSRVGHLIRAAIYPLALLLPVLVWLLTVTPAFVVAPVAILVAAFIAMNYAARARPVIERGALTVRYGDVWVGARRLVARGRLTSGVVMPGPEGTFVRLERRGGPPIDLHVEGTDAGRALLLELGLDEAHAVARFRVLATSPEAWQQRARWAIASALPLVITVPFALALDVPFLIPLISPFVVAMALSTVVPARVTVGSDGISARRFGREEFIPLDGIASAVVADEDSSMNTRISVVRLLDDDGAVVRTLAVDQKKDGPFSEAILAAVDARAAALAERIRAVIAMRKRRAGAIDPRTLARGDRDVAAWLSDLRSLRNRARGFRDAEAPRPEALLAIVEDAAAQPTARVAAVLALAPNGPAERRRVRIAAEATAAPALRIALEAALDDDENTLATALAELER